MGGRKSRRRALIVAMNGLEVGCLTAGAGGLRFSYEPTWLEMEQALPLSMSLPLSPTSYVGARVESFFENLLPDSVDLRQRMQSRFGTASAQAFDLLEACGRDCVGAVQLLPADEAVEVRQVLAEPVSDAEISRTLRDHRRAPLGMLPEHDDFRISIAGAQEKTGFLWFRGRWHRPFGPTPTSHIFKLPIGQLPYGPDLTDSVENEWLCLRLAQALGVEAASAEVGVFGDVRALVVRRFDRKWSRDGSWLVRVPHEDLCQALGLPGGRKYEVDGGPGITSILGFLRGSVTPIADQRRFLRACIVFWLLAAIDGHAKNFSIRILPGGRFVLAPIYDVVSAYPLVASGDLDRHRLKLAMAAVGKNKHYRHRDIARRHWLSTVRSGGFPPREVEEMLVELAAGIEVAIAKVSGDLPADFPDHVAGPIFEGLKSTGRLLVGIST